MDLSFGLIPVVGEYVAAVIDAAFVATVTTLIYFDLRLRKDGRLTGEFLELIGVPTVAAPTAVKPAATAPTATVAPDRVDVAPVPPDIPPSSNLVEPRRRGS